MAFEVSDSGPSAYFEVSIELNLIRYEISTWQDIVYTSGLAH
jgi:hypothetical protein